MKTRILIKQNAFRGIRSKVTFNLFLTLMRPLPSLGSKPKGERVLLGHQDLDFFKESYLKAL